MIANWVIGVLLAILASFISNLGLNLQKLNHLRNDQLQRQQLLQEEEQEEESTQRQSQDTSQQQKEKQGEEGEGEEEDEPLPRLQRSGADTPSSRLSPYFPSVSVLGSADPFPHQSQHTKKVSERVAPLSPLTLDSKERSSSSSQNTSSLYPKRTAHFASPITTSVPHSYHSLDDTDRPLFTPSNNNNDESGSVSPSPANSPSPCERLEHSHSNINTGLLSYSYSYYRQGLWCVGLVLVFIGSLADFAALMFAAQSIVAPLGSLTLVSNTVLAPAILKESVTRSDVMATIGIVVGSVLCVSFADHRDRLYATTELFALFAHLRFILYTCVIIICIAFLYRRINAIQHILHTQPASIYLHYRRIHRFAYAALAGIVGAQSVLFGKCIGEMLVTSVSGDDIMFLHWQTYLILLLLSFTITAQIHYLNEGLRQFTSLYIVPVFQSFWIITSVISGMIFFGEYRGVFDETSSSLGFPLGVIITVGGVYVLSQKGGLLDRADVDELLREREVHRGEQEMMTSKQGYHGASSHHPHVLHSGVAASSGGSSDTEVVILRDLGEPERAHSSPLLSVTQTDHVTLSSFPSVTSQFFALPPPPLPLPPHHHHRTMHGAYSLGGRGGRRSSGRHHRHRHHHNQPPQQQPFGIGAVVSTTAIDPQTAPLMDEQPCVCVPLSSSSPIHVPIISLTSDSSNNSALHEQGGGER